MIKNKNSSTKRHKITSFFGYGIFALLILAFAFTILVPMVIALQYPTARHFNIITMVLSFGIAMIVPALTAYLIGDKSTHSNKRTLHHYNGILFAFLAYWTAMLLSWIGFSSVFGVSDKEYPLPLIVTNITPVILTIIVVVTLSILFAKNQKKNASVLQFLPFQILFIISIVGTFLVPYLYVAYNPTDLLPSLLFLAIPFGAVLLAYIVLKDFKTSRLARFSDALVAMSIGWITIWLASSFLSLVRLPYEVANILAYVVALGVYALYLYLRVRR